MPYVKKIHIHYYTKRGKTRKTIDFVPSGQTPLEMKIDVAKELRKIKATLKKYYVVVEVRRSDGASGFRTIVPMTII